VSFGTEHPKPREEKYFFLDMSHDSVNTHYTRLMAVSHHRMKSIVFLEH